MSSGPEHRLDLAFLLLCDPGTTMEDIIPTVSHASLNSNPPRRVRSMLCYCWRPCVSRADCRLRSDGVSELRLQARRLVDARKLPPDFLPAFEAEWGAFRSPTYYSPPCMGEIVATKL